MPHQENIWVMTRKNLWIILRVRPKSPSRLKEMNRATRGRGSDPARFIHTGLGGVCAGSGGLVSARQPCWNEREWNAGWERIDWSERKNWSEHLWIIIADRSGPKTRGWVAVIDTHTHELTEITVSLSGSCDEFCAAMCLWRKLIQSDGFVRDCVARSHPDSVSHLPQRCEVCIITDGPVSHFIWVVLCFFNAFFYILVENVFSVDEDTFDENMKV